MDPATAAHTAAQSVRDALHDATRHMVDRETLMELVLLAAVAREHVLVIGPPGTAKSAAARRIAQAIGGRYFEYLLGRFTEPSEIFGPIDLRKLREGSVETQTDGMLPEADVAFLDEVFLGSTAILNTLLGVLNERRFRRGHTDLVCPLRVCVGASNRLPDDPALEAFADRFLVRSFLERVSDPQLEELLEAGSALDASASLRTTSLAALDALSAAADAMDLSSLRGSLAHAIRALRRAGIDFSDRRAVKSQRLVAAASALAGRSKASEADLWPLVFVVPSREGQELARDVLQALLARAENDSLPAAASAASAGARARAGRIAVEARARLSEDPGSADPTAREAWELKLEGILREIDAGFERDALDAELAALRERIASIVGRESELEPRAP